MDRTPGAESGTRMLWAAFILLASFTQLAFKWAGNAIGSEDLGLEFVLRALAEPSVILAILGYLGMFVMWMRILKTTPLARAYLITAIVFVPVTIGAWVLFGESITPLRAFGIAAVMAGVAIIAA